MDLIKLRDSILAGATDLELAMNPETLTASANFVQWTRIIRAASRNHRAQEYDKERMTNIILKDWQEKELALLDTYETSYNGCPLKVDRPLKNLICSKYTLTRRQDGRGVTWIWSKQGGVGKTFFADWLAVWRKAFVITGGKHTDITYSYAWEDYIVFDYARARFRNFPYALVEDFKNGRVYSPKYESVTKRVHDIRVIVFANFPPDRTEMSMDRWRVAQVGCYAYIAIQPQQTLPREEIEEVNDFQIVC